MINVLPLFICGGGEEAQLLKEDGKKVWRGQVNLNTLPVGELRQAINISSLTIYDMGVTTHTMY